MTPITIDWYKIPNIKTSRYVFMLFFYRFTMAVLRPSQSSSAAPVMRDSEKEFSDDDDENSPLNQDIYGGR